MSGGKEDTEGVRGEKVRCGVRGRWCLSRERKVSFAVGEERDSGKLEKGGRGVEGVHGDGLPDSLVREEPLGENV